MSKKVSGRESSAADFGESGNGLILVNPRIFAVVEDAIAEILCCLLDLIGYSMRRNDDVKKLIKQENVKEKDSKNMTIDFGKISDYSKFTVSAGSHFT